MMVIVVCWEILKYSYSTDIELFRNNCNTYVFISAYGECIL